MKITTLKFILYLIINLQMFFLFIGCSSNIEQPLNINILPDSLQQLMQKSDTLFLITLGNYGCIPCVENYINTINALQLKNKNIVVLMPHIRKIEKNNYFKRFNFNFKKSTLMIENNLLYNFYKKQSDFKTDANGLYVYVKNQLIFKCELKKSAYPIKYAVWE